MTEPLPDSSPDHLVDHETKAVLAEIEKSIEEDRKEKAGDSKLQTAALFFIALLLGLLFSYGLIRFFSEKVLSNYAPPAP